MKAYEVRASARESLQGKWGKSALLTLIYIVTVFVISYLLGLVPFVGAIIDIIITPALAFGILSVFIRLSRGENPRFFDFLTNGFNCLGKLWAIALHTFLKIGVFILLAFVSGFLMGFGSESGVLFTILGIILYIFSMVSIVIKSLLYVLTSYVLYDEPNLTAKEIVEKSEMLMKGNRWRLICLELSFIGWALLTIFTLGIGTLWLSPYTEVAIIKFYEHLASSNNV